MNEEENFLQAIRENPADPHLPLIFADWREEQGDPRGELLRILHETAQTPIYSARYRKLRMRRDKLCKLCDSEWLKPMLRVPFSEIRKPRWANCGNSANWN